MKALVGATLIDGTGGPVIEDSVVLVDGDAIDAVGVRGGVDIPPGAEQIDLRGLT